MRLLPIFALLTASCSSSTDPCDGFAGKTCVTLEVRGSQTVDQIRLTSVELQITDGATPPVVMGPFSLPVQLAVLPADPRFAGPFTLEVRGLDIGTVVGSDRLNAQFQPGEHRRLVADLGGANAVDLAGSSPDLSGVDLAGIDLSGIDLAGPAQDLSSVVSPHWVAQPSGNPQQLARIWGSSSTDLYVGGYHGGILHSTGNGTWTLQASVGTTLTMLSGLWGSGAGDIYAGGGLSPNHVLVHSTGNGNWAPQTIPTVDDVESIGGFDATHVWAATQGAMLHLVAGNWQKETSGVPAVFLASAFAVAPNSVWVGASGNGVLFSPGDTNWSAQALPGGGGANDIWGSGPDDIWVAATTKGQVFHSTGNLTWTAQNLPSTATMSAIGGSSATNIYVGGFGGVIFHSTGNGSWSPETVDMSGINEITSIFVLPSGDAWATTDNGNPGVVLHRVTP